MQNEWPPRGSTGFDKYSFFDCGAFGLFTLSDERFQPKAYGKRAYSPSTFFIEREKRAIDPNKVHLWNELGPALRTLGDATTVLDVGGYIGTFCIPLALSAQASGLDLTFHSFEPGPTRELLAINVQANGLASRVTVHDAAMSSFDGHTIYRFKTGGSIGGAVFGNGSSDDIERVAPCFTIDRFCKDVVGRMFIKLDTQGHEPDIMNSARLTISQKRAIWQIEFIAWAARKDIGGQSFADFLLQEFYLFEGHREINALTMPDFLNEIDARASRMADMTLIPRGAPFVENLLAQVRQG
ncbi:FkbM family methyltransferase [Mesorhizobium sp. CAU 1732]|uniref:FkbM family methyltransferase n=1 Tax=Mesorhizobium sp. CAU 1732 TaxID=3140358 RepID=UPI00325FE520